MFPSWFDPFFRNTFHLCVIRPRFISDQQEPSRGSGLRSPAQRDRQPKDANSALSQTWAPQVLKPLRDRSVSHWCCFTTWRVLILGQIYSNTDDHMEALMTYHVMRHCLRCHCLTCEAFYYSNLWYFDNSNCWRVKYLSYHCAADIIISNSNERHLKYGGVGGSHSSDYCVTFQM